MASGSSNDDATDRRLRLLVGLVVVLALLATGAVITYTLTRATPAPNFFVVVLICAAVVPSHLLRVYFRVRDSHDATTWGEVPVLIGLALLPAPWVIICTAVGTVILKLLTGNSVLRSTWMVAKETLSAAAATIVFLLFRVHSDAAHPPFAVAATIVALCAMALVDQAAFLPVMAISTGMRIRRAAAANLDVKLAGYAVRLGVTLLLLAIIAFARDTLLIVLLPLIVVCLHLWQSRRVRTREERESWQRLAEATDALNAVDLTHVLRSAVSDAAVLFSASEAEIDLSKGGIDRVVIGTADEILFDEPRASVDPSGTEELSTELVAHSGDVRVGVLRLRFGGRIKLTEFEQYKLQTFASALCTAIRNALAYAELARLNEQNAYAARHDPLTGLPNRRELYDRAGTYFGAATSDGVTALLLIDLNHFKEVNDTLGHAAGDIVLRQVARRLSDAATGDDLVARLGGDEFAVLLTNLATPALAGHRAAALLGALEGALEVEGMAIIVEAAAGIALAPGSGGINELMRRADVAMYQAKRGGGQQIVTYTHGHDSADVGRLLLGGELQRAVAEHEFVVDFQPIVDLGSGEAISVEALARWQHPEHGHLTPIQFLETVERSGQLPAFAGAVLDQALTSAVIWRDNGFDLPVSVNVSPRSLLDPRFPDDVLARLERHAVPPAKLVLELAETLTISQLDVVSRALSELRDAGVQLALDDFGTGVSPLSVLSRVPVHQLKIDREFVTAIETSSEAAAVIRSTVDLARSLHLTVIAEGVESEPQRLALWELGCVAGQGHLFARPVSSIRLLAALQRGTSGRPGVLAAALHDAGSVVRMPQRRSPGNGRGSLPHLRA